MPALLEDLPLYRVTIQLRSAPKSVEMFNPTSILRQSGNKIEATINDLHEVIQIGY